MRLINADNLLEKTWETESGFDVVDTYIIEDEPTIDAVQVVRCKDCKNFMEYKATYRPDVEKANGDCYIRVVRSDDRQFWAVQYDDFCSLGQKGKPDIPCVST